MPSVKFFSMTQKIFTFLSNTCHISSTHKFHIPMTSHVLGIPYHCMSYSIGLYSLCPTIHQLFPASLSLIKSGCKPPLRNLPWKFYSTLRTRYFPRACFHDSLIRY